MNEPTLENWQVAYETQDPYCPPECNGRILIGTVTGHSRHKDGTQIQTSRLTATEGRMVTTHSGTRYRLGEPSTGYRDWLRDHNPDWDPENPITLVTK